MALSFSNRNYLVQKKWSPTVWDSSLRKRQDWPWYRVKAVVEANNKTLSAIAVENGFTPSAAHKVKRVPIPRIQKLIAKAIRLSPQEIWPTRYDRRGKPVRSFLWVKNNTHKASRNLQKPNADPIPLLSNNRKT